MTRRVRYRVVPDVRGRNGPIVLRDQGEGSQDVTYWAVGRLGEQGRRKWVDWRFDKEAVIGIFGRRGSGKSYTLGALLEAMATTSPKHGVGGNVGDRGALLFDTLNIFQHATVGAHEVADEELKEEAVKNLRRFGMDSVEADELRFEMFHPAGEDRPYYDDNYQPFAVDTSILRPEDYGHVFDIDIYRDPMGQLLLAADEKNRGDGRQSDEGKDGEYGGLIGLIACLESDADLEEQFAADTRRALVSRLRTLAQRAVFSQSATNIDSLIEPGKVTVLLLAHLSPTLRSVVAALLVRQLFQARATAAEASNTLKLDPDIGEERRKRASEEIEQAPPRTILCFDEAQGYAPPQMSNPCTAALTQYVKEGRNYGLSLVLTTQQPSAIHGDILSQLDGVLSHRLTVPKDINTALNHAKARSPEKIVSEGSELDESELIRELSVGQAWLSHGEVNRSLIVNIRPRVTAHGGIEA